MGAKYASGLSAGQYADLLKADFSELENVQKLVDQTLYKLMVRDYKSSQAYKHGVSFNQWKVGALKETGGFATLVRQKLGATLAIIRANAVKAARSGMASDRGAASTAVHRRMYKNELAGNINIIGSGRRMSSKRRLYTPGKLRDVQQRTKDINEYYGPDRAFILRILNSGRDVYMAQSGTGAGGRGSRQTYGRRGAIAPRNFFHSMGVDMQQAAAQLGYDLKQICEEFLATEFKEA